MVISGRLIVHRSGHQATHKLPFHVHAKKVGFSMLLLLNTIYVSILVKSMSGALVTCQRDFWRVAAGGGAHDDGHAGKYDGSLAAAHEHREISDNTTYGCVAI